MEQYTACFSKRLPATPDDPCSPSHRAGALGKHALMQLRRELLHKEGPLGFLAAFSPCCLGGTSCQCSGWVGCARLLSGSLLFCQGKQSPESDGELSQHVIPGVLPVGLGEGPNHSCHLSLAPKSFPFLFLLLLPSFKLGEGRGKEAVFDLSGGKKSVLFRLLANTTNSV